LEWSYKRNVVGSRCGVTNRNAEGRDVLPMSMHNEDKRSGEAAIVDRAVETVVSAKQAIEARRGGFGDYDEHGRVVHVAYLRPCKGVVIDETSTG
jgi:hypothetical protein